MKPRDYVLEQLNHRQTHPVPFTLTFEGDVRDRLDAHYGGEDWRRRLTPYLTMVSPVNPNPMTQISDIRCQDIYGGIWRTDSRARHLETPPLCKPSFDGYDFPKPEAFFPADWMERARQACDENRDSFLVAYFYWGLFERSWTLRGFEDALMDAVAEPDFYEEMLDKLTEQYLAFVEYSNDLPIDGFLFGDDWGDQRGVILGPDRWRKYIKPRWAKIYQDVHDRGKFVLSHCCGSVADIMPDIIEMGLDVLESVQPEPAGMCPYDLKKQWGDKITFWGGLGSQSTIPFGTPAEITDEVARLTREMGRGGGYILAPAKGLQPETPTENAVAVVEAFTNQPKA